MKYEAFRQAFSKKNVITIEDILIRFPDIDRKQLTRWVQSGLLHHPARGIYMGSDSVLGTEVFLELGHILVQPSYISLEYALAYYGLIPEEVAVYTCVTTKKTQSYDLDNFGRYRYQSIIPRAFIGYEVRSISGVSVYIASPEKAILDFLYYHRDYMSDDDFHEWRINVDQFFAISSIEKLRGFLSLYRNQSFSRQVEQFISYLLREYA